MFRKIFGLALFAGSSAGAITLPIVFPTLRMVGNEPVAPRFSYYDLDGGGAQTVFFPLDKDWLAIVSFDLVPNQRPSRKEPFVLKQEAFALYHRGRLTRAGDSPKFVLSHKGGLAELKGSVSVDLEDYDESTKTIAHRTWIKEIDLKDIPVLPTNASYQEVLKALHSIPGFKNVKMDRASEA